MTDTTFRGDDRGVSTTISYVLNLTLAAILVSGLLFAAGSVVENERESAIREELDVIGQRIAISIHQANRTVATTPDGAATTLRVQVDAPTRVAGSGYTVSVDTSGTEPVLHLTTEDPEVTVTVPLSIEDGISAGSVTGGPLVVVLDGGDLEVREQ